MGFQYMGRCTVYFGENSHGLMENPTPDELTKAFAKASEPLKKQLLIEFEVPPYFHTRATWKYYCWLAVSTWTRLRMQTGSSQ